MGITLSIWDYIFRTNYWPKMIKSSYWFCLSGQEKPQENFISQNIVQF
jgi:hypothetical protein